MGCQALILGLVVLYVLKAPRVAVWLARCSGMAQGRAAADASSGSCDGGVSTAYASHACQRGSTWELWC